MAAARKQPDAPEVGTAVTPRDPNAPKKSLLNARLERMKPALQNVLPAHTTADRATMLALFYVAKSPSLLGCDVESIAEGVMQIAQWGLEIGRTAHLVPFKGKVVAIADWKGKVELALRGKSITSFRARVVYEHDAFDVEYGLHEQLIHKPTWRADPGEPVGVYAVVGLPSGEQKFDLMSVADVERIRRRSRASGDGPWVTDWDEMAKKTVSHRLLKGVPTNPMLAEAEANDELVEEREATADAVKGGLTRQHVRGGDGYDALPKRERNIIANAQSVEAEVIEMADRPVPTKPLPEDPYGPEVGESQEEYELRMDREMLKREGQ